MKKKIHKIWGVGLALVLVTTLVAFAAPVSAGTLKWSSEDIPDADNYVLLSSSSVTDLAVAAEGETIYAATGTQYIYRSIDRGETWSEITVLTNSDNLTAADLVAVAPDDENFVATANITHAYLSDDAGATWETLGTPTGIEEIVDLAVSVEKAGNHFVAVVGEDSSKAEVWYYEIGAIAAAWKEATTGDMALGFSTGDDEAGAVAFSPNFASDEVMVVVTANTTGNTVNFQIFSFDQKQWNEEGAEFADYPVDLAQDTPTDITSLDSASISLATDYLGSDDALRIAFVGLTVNSPSYTSPATETETSSIQRLDDDDNSVLKDEVHIHSVAFDGTNLVAGRYDDVHVYYSDDPLATTPTVRAATTLKRPGGENLVVVAWAGADVVAGTSGDESAFAISRNNGKTFNDLSLIDTTLTVLSDVAVSPDGSIVYMVTADSASAAADLSVWRLASSWERVLSKQAADNDFIVRLAPDDADVVYVADTGVDDTKLYYSEDGGETKWFGRVSTYDIYDLAVETDGQVAYVLSTKGYVSRSENAGFTWATWTSSKLTAGGNMLISLGEDLLLAGSTNGYVAYSTDGNTTWTKLDDKMGDAVQVIATGLEDGDFILAASNSKSSTYQYIYQWELAEDDEWSAITEEGDIPSTHGVYGLALEGDVLYAMSANSTDSKSLRTLTPTDDSPTWSTMDSLDESFDATPSALRVSLSEDITKLWAVDSVGDYLFSYEDTLATIGPTLTAPIDGYGVQINPVTGRAWQITFTWENPSDKINEYDLVVALDEAFDEAVLYTAVAKSTATWDEGDIISAVAGPLAADYPVDFMPDTTYYWKVRVDYAGPIRSQYSEVRSFTVGSLPEVAPVEVVIPPPAEITIEVPPAPEVILPAPEIILPAPLPAPEVVIPPAPAPVPAIPDYALWAIIIIGAILVIAVIVLIVRTRRPA